MTNEFIGQLAPLNAAMERVLAECEPVVEHPEFIRYPMAPDGGRCDFAHLFRGLPESEIAGYERIHKLTIPSHYRQLLAQLNGGHVWEFTLNGLPATMRKEPPLLDRLGEMPSGFFARWGSISLRLEDELDRAEAGWPEYLEFFAKGRSGRSNAESGAGRPWWKFWAR
jgi:hypothetical protein